MADVNLRKIVVDGIPVEVSDQAAAVIEKLQKQVETSVQVAADAKAKNSVVIKIGDSSVEYTADQVAKMVADKDAEIADLKSKAVTPQILDGLVKARTSVIGDAKRLVPEIVVDGKDCAAIRKEVVGKFTAVDGSMKTVLSAIMQGKTVDAADEETIKTAFNVLAVQAMPQVVGNDGKLFVTQQLNNSAPVGREAWLLKTQNQFQAQGDK